MASRGGGRRRPTSRLPPFRCANRGKRSAGAHALACAALDALGECVLVLGPRARDVVYAPKVLAPLFDALLDRSSTKKRELALRVLGRLAAHAGCVVAPYLEHAPLLPRVLAVVCENSAARATREDDKPLATQHATWSLCREALTNSRACSAPWTPTPSTWSNGAGETRVRAPESAR